MIRIGVIGYGYWGPNIVRNFNGVEGAKVVSLCDINSDVLILANKKYPHLELTRDYDEIITRNDIDVVAIVTPVSTHFELSKRALQNGKHIFVEKPFTSSVEQAEELIELADRNRLKIMVDHTYIFNGAVRKIKQLVDDNVLGDILYFDSMRVNLGLFQHDYNVIWDLAPHDLSVLDYLINETPSAVVATGKAHYGKGLEDIAYITIYFPNDIIAHVNVNWLSPVKVRQTLMGGKKKMLVWNDINVDEKIKVYDKGVEITNREGLYKLLVSYRSGDMWAPKVSPTEALKIESEYFIDCILNDKTPINDGQAGLRIVKILEAADKSMKKREELVYL
ncbi:MAG: Gfo/Idh/MocA family protein [Promethearchaeota archaeon]